MSFFDAVTLNNVLIKDLHKDTLIYADQIKLEIEDYDLNAHQLNISHLELINSNIKLIKYENEDFLNYHFLVKNFKDSTRKKVSWNISADNIQITNSSFAYRNEHRDFITKGMNYFDIQTNQINGVLNHVQFENDTITGEITALSAKEKCGIELKNLTSQVKVSSVGIELNKLDITTLHSTIATDLTLDYERYQCFYSFIDSVSFNGNFNNSMVSIKDIAFFAPSLKNIPQKLIVSGQIKGKVNNINGKKLNIRLPNSTSQFLGNVKLTGLPNFDETFIYIKAKQLSTNYSDLQKLASTSFYKNKKITISPKINQLGQMKFKGTFTGLYTDFYAYGDFSSAIGDLSLDLSMGYNYQSKKELYKGKLKAHEFDFGKLLGTPLLGKASTNIVINGEGLTIKNIKANLEGTISEIEFKDYTYKNVTIKGLAANQIFSGNMQVLDKYIDFDFNGIIDISKKLPEYNFSTSIRKANLNALNFIELKDSVNFSTNAVINIKGNRIDEMEGYVNFKNTSFNQANKSLSSSMIYITSTISNDQKNLSIISDFIDGEIKGRFRLTHLLSSLNNTMHNYIPNYFSLVPIEKTKHKQEFKFDISLKNTGNITNFFAPNIAVANGTTLIGEYNNTKNNIKFHGNSTLLKINNLTLTDYAFDINGKQTFTFNNSCKKLLIGDSLSFDNISLNHIVEADSISSQVAWNNNTDLKFNGDITSFVKIDTNQTIEFRIPKSQITIADSTWLIEMPQITKIDSALISINQLIITHNQQYVSVKGILSERKNDQLKLEFKNFDLSNLNIYTQPTGLSLKGVLNGKSTLSDIFNDPLLVSDNHFDSLYINESKIGNGDIESIWNNNKKALFLHGSFTLEEKPNILLSGYYYPTRKDNNLDIELNLRTIQLKVFKPYVNKFCSDFEGYLSGNIVVNGTLKKPNSSGFINIFGEKITVSYLNTSYHFNHRIGVTNNSFTVENMKLFDINQHEAIVNGALFHEYFKNFQLDFDIETNKFMCLNTSEAQNSYFYGKAFATGYTNISGYLNDLFIEVDAKTESISADDQTEDINLLSKNEITKLFIPLSNSKELSDNNFITFVQKNSTQNENDYEIKLDGITMNFNLSVTPDAEIQLIFDQQVGDIIKAKGNGSIKLDINTIGDFKMYGDYTIDKGDYLFTLKNVINKKFNIEQGSIIKWSGSPYDAYISINTTYKTRALLSPFFDTLSKNINFTKRYPIDLQLALSGNLSSPDIHFGIDIPNVDPSVRQTVFNYLNNDTEMNRQVVPLLLLSRFISPTSRNNEVATNTAIGSSSAANTGELISNQINNMLSSVSKDFQVGVNYQPGDALTEDELDIAISTELFNNKLVIDGNLGTNNNNNSINSDANNIVGDVNINYKLTKDGKLRIKAFTKPNNNINIASNGNYTQGLGILYREEFNTLGELARRIFRKKSKK